MFHLASHTPTFVWLYCSLERIGFFPLWFPFYNFFNPYFFSLWSMWNSNMVPKVKIQNYFIVECIFPVVRCGSNFMSFQMAIQLSPNHLLKSLSSVQYFRYHVLSYTIIPFLLGFISGVSVLCSITVCKGQYSL